MKKALPRISMLMLTPTERQYLDLAAQSLQDVKTERELVQWHDCFMGGDEYLHLHDDGIRELERAYQSKVAWFYGIGGG